MEQMTFLCPDPFISSPTHKEIPINTVWTLTNNLPICFENINSSGILSGFVPLKMYDYTLLYDANDHEFTTQWALSDYNITSYVTSLMLGNSRNNTTQSCKCPAPIYYKGSR